MPGGEIASKYLSRGEERERGGRRDINLMTVGPVWWLCGVHLPNLFHCVCEHFLNKNSEEAPCSPRKSHAAQVGLCIVTLRLLEKVICGPSGDHLPEKHKERRRKNPCCEELLSRRLYYSRIYTVIQHNTANNAVLFRSCFVLFLTFSSKWLIFPN